MVAYKLKLSSNQAGAEMYEQMKSNTKTKKHIKYVYCYIQYVLRYPLKNVYMKHTNTHTQKGTTNRDKKAKTQTHKHIYTIRICVHEEHNKKQEQQAQIAKTNRQTSKQASKQTNKQTSKTNN